MSHTEIYYDTVPGGFRQQNTVQKYTTAQYLGQLMRQGEQPIQQPTLEHIDLLMKTSHVRKMCGVSTVQELIAKVGVSIPQLFDMTEKQLEQFCKQAQANRANEAREPVFVL
jgi:hypothetical protein